MPPLHYYGMDVETCLALSFEPQTYKLNQPKKIVETLYFSRE